MRRASRLAVLDEAAARKLQRFARRASLLVSGAGLDRQPLTAHELETELSLLTINLQSFWSNWCRALFMSLALGAFARSGSRLSSSLAIANEHDALSFAITGRLPAPPNPWPSYREPKWFSPIDLAGIITAAGITNSAQLSLVLHSLSASLDDLRVVRNYMAHRGEALKSQAMAIGPKYLVGAASKPSEILMFVEPGRSVSVVERWIIELQRGCRALTA